MTTVVQVATPYNGNAIYNSQGCNKSNPLCVVQGVVIYSHFKIQAGMENPTISLHVIGLNGPTHDREMTPPDDQRMR